SINHMTVNGVSLPLTRTGGHLETPEFVALDPASSGVPIGVMSVGVVNGTFSWSYNPTGSGDALRLYPLHERDSVMYALVQKVAAEMRRDYETGIWVPNPIDKGAFGSEFHTRMTNEIRTLSLTDLHWYADVSINDKMIVSTSPGTNGTQIDA